MLPIWLPAHKQHDHYFDKSMFGSISSRVATHAPTWGCWSWIFGGCFHIDVENSGRRSTPKNLKTSTSGFGRPFSPTWEPTKESIDAGNCWNEPSGDHIASWMHGGKFHPIPRSRNALTPRKKHNPSALLRPCACTSWPPSPEVGQEFLGQGWVFGNPRFLEMTPMLIVGRIPIPKWLNIRQGNKQK